MGREKSRKKYLALLFVSVLLLLTACANSTPKKTINIIRFTEDQNIDDIKLIKDTKAAFKVDYVINSVPKSEKISSGRKNIWISYEFLNENKELVLELINKKHYVLIQGDRTKSEVMDALDIPGDKRSPSFFDPVNNILGVIVIKGSSMYYAYTVNKILNPDQINARYTELFYSYLIEERTIK